MGVQGAVQAVDTVGDAAGALADSLVGAAVSPYVPSPMDTSLLGPQLVSLFFVLVCVGYWQVILVPTSQLKFNLSQVGPHHLCPPKPLTHHLGKCGACVLRRFTEGAQDKEKRRFINELKASEDRPLEKWLYAQWLKPLARPRGDQTGGVDSDKDAVGR
jgi:hypothetical protein